MHLTLDLCCIQGDSAVIAAPAETASAEGLGSTQPHYLLLFLPPCRTMLAWGMRLCTGTPGQSCGLLLTRAGLSTARSVNTLPPSNQHLWYAAPSLHRLHTKKIQKKKYVCVVARARALVYVCVLGGAGMRREGRDVCVLSCTSVVMATRSC